MPSARIGRMRADPGSPAIDAIRRVGVECRLIIIRRLMDRPLRFHELQHAGAGIEGKSLSRVLKYLVGEGIVERHVLPTQPVAVEYALTSKGRELRPVLDALDHWGGKWLAPAAEPVRA